MSVNVLAFSEDRYFQAFPSFPVSESALVLSNLPRILQSASDISLLGIGTAFHFVLPCIIFTSKDNKKAVGVCSSNFNFAVRFLTVRLGDLFFSLSLSLIIYLYS